MDMETTWFCERSGHLSIGRVEGRAGRSDRSRESSEQVRLVGVSPYALGTLSHQRGASWDDDDTWRD